MKNTINSQVHLMTVDNDVVGRQKIADLRKSMKESKSTLRVVLYGRGHRHGITRYRQSLPLPKASHVAVYTSL